MSAFRNHEGGTFIEKGRNKLNYRIGPLRSDSVIKLVSDLITESDQAVAVHSCNSWFLLLLCPLIYSRLKICLFWYDVFLYILMYVYLFF